MKKTFFAVAAVITSSLHAQEPKQDSSISVLNEVVLTASRYPRKQSETGKVVNVITRAEIERSHGRTLGEVLNTAPGVNIIGTNNNAGTNLTASIRGSSAGNVLILLDGIPVNDPSVNTNYFDLNFISLEYIERIEILKGGQSTLYGSDAVAGVINIISKKTTDKAIAVDGNFTGGSYQTFKQSLGVRGAKSKSDYSFNYSHISSDGFSNAFDQQNTGVFDRDGYNQHAASARFGFKPIERLKIQFAGNWSKYRTGLDASAFTDDRDYVARNDNKQIGSSIVWQVSKATITGNYNFNRAERRYLDDSAHKSSPFVDFSESEFIGRTHYAELYSTIQFSNWQLLVGTDFRSNNTEQSYFSVGPFGPYTAPFLDADMNQFSGFSSIVLNTIKNFNLEAGGRWNVHSEYGNNFTFTLNPSYHIGNAKAFINLYSAFKTPTLYQLFDPAAGNADLKPEYSTVAEAGVSLELSKSLSGRAVLYYSNTKNAILYTFNPSTFASKYENAAKQKTYGTELEFAYTKDKWRVKANYTYTEGEITAAFDGTGSPLGKDTSYSALYRIPRHNLNLSVGYQATKSILVNVDVRSVSDRKEFIYGGAPENLDGYTLVNLYGEYRFDRFVRVFIDLKNITNKQYFDFLGYNTRRFNFTTGISFQL